MTYSKIVSNEILTHHTQKGAIILDSIEDCPWVRSPVEVTSSLPLINPVIQDVFGDVVCGLLSEMRELWSPYGFLDICQTHLHIIDMFDIIKRNIQMRVIDEEDMDQEEENNIKDCVII